MMRNARLQRIAVAVVVLFLSVSAFAQRTRPSATPNGLSLFDGTSPVPGTLTPCMFVLNLTDAQKAQIQSILAAAQPTLQSLSSILQADRTALNAAATSPAVNSCDVGTAYLRQLADEDALQAELKALQPQIESILTADQKSKVAGCLAALANFGHGMP